MLIMSNNWSPTSLGTSRVRVTESREVMSQSGEKEKRENLPAPVVWKERSWFSGSQWGFGWAVFQNGTAVTPAGRRAGIRSHILSRHRAPAEPHPPHFDQLVEDCQQHDDYHWQKHTWGNIQRFFYTHWMLNRFHMTPHTWSHISMTKWTGCWALRFKSTVNPKLDFEKKIIIIAAENLGNPPNKQIIP